MSAMEWLTTHKWWIIGGGGAVIGLYILYSSGAKSSAPSGRTVVSNAPTAAELQAELASQKISAQSQAAQTAANDQLSAVKAQTGAAVAATQSTNTSKVQIASLGASVQKLVAQIEGTTAQQANKIAGQVATQKIQAGVTTTQLNDQTMLGLIKNNNATAVKNQQILASAFKDQVATKASMQTSAQNFTASQQQAASSRVTKQKGSLGNQQTDLHNQIVSLQATMAANRKKGDTAAAKQDASVINQDLTQISSLGQKINALGA